MQAKPMYNHVITRTAQPSNPNGMQIRLAMSLACYCSGDDFENCDTREDFLKTVISRIEDDLTYKTA